MLATITIIRYKTWGIPFGFLSMAVFHFPLFFNKNISFYKLMGSGKNGTFDKEPDLKQWAILTVHKENDDESFKKNDIASLYGKLVAYWLRLFKCECCIFYLIPVEGHGYWDKKHVFGSLKNNSGIDGPIAILTRATIRLSRLSYFWRHVAPVAAQMTIAKGFITSYGIGEIPWIKQATFSIWKSKEDMKAFAYGMKEHVEVIKKTRQEKWYSEDMFVRFKILHIHGTVKGQCPLDLIIE